MRTIKFRAWDKKDKVMREVYGIQFPKISNHGNRQNTIIEMHCSDYDGQKAIILSDFTDSVDRVELMQFTGLKDKNGVEIYEGDIVRYLTGNEDGGYIDEVVEFLGGAYQTLCTMPENEFEVIGNIYEHSYLLDK